MLTMPTMTVQTTKGKGGNNNHADNADRETMTAHGGNTGENDAENYDSCDRQC